MARLRPNRILLRAIWCAAFFGTTALILAVAADAIYKRLWLLTLLSWLSFPASFAIVPLVNRALGAFDVENVKVIDGVVASFIGLAGYVQWFHLVPLIFGRRTEGPSAPSE